ncbi:unnamed protein product, partial [Mesorhabditis spiculigera]
MLFVYVLVLVLYTGELSAQNTAPNVTMCLPKGVPCPGCEERLTLCPGKDGVSLCTYKEQLVDPDSGVCQFIGCPIGETDINGPTNRSCIPLKNIVNGSLPTGWWWDGCSSPSHINCGNYLPVCIHSASLTAYNLSMGGCIYEGCPPGRYPCKVEDGTECISYDDLKTIIYKSGGSECIRATAEEKAAARATVPPAAQEKTEPKGASSSARHYWHPVNSVLIIVSIMLGIWIGATF